METIYEVNLTVSDEIREEYEAWLGPHIDEIMELGLFEGAWWMEREEEGEGSRWTLYYRLGKRENLTDYQENHAKRLIGDGMERFGGKFEASRRVMNLKREFISK